MTKQRSIKDLFLYGIKNSKILPVIASAQDSAMLPALVANQWSLRIWFILFTHESGHKINELKFISSSPKKLLQLEKCGTPAQGRCRLSFFKEILLRDIFLGNLSGQAVNFTYVNPRWL